MRNTERPKNLGERRERRDSTSAMNPRRRIVGRTCDLDPKLLLAIAAVEPSPECEAGTEHSINAG
jgi:hypothetical protein